MLKLAFCGRGSIIIIIIISVDSMDHDVWMLQIIEPFYRSVRNPGRDMQVLFFNLFRRLNMLFERLNILFAQLIILFERHN